MKKIFSVLLSTALILSMTGCSSNGSSTAATGGGASDSNTGETYTLKMAIVSNSTHTHNVAINQWAEEVKAETEGRLEIVLLDSGQLGGERDYIESMQLGTLDMAQVSSAVVGNFLPDYNVMSLPYLFDSYESIETITQGDIGTALTAQLDSINLVGLTWFSNGFRSVFTNTENIQTPEDMSGVKVRVMESSVMIDSLNAMGASATPMAYGELYTAIQQGVLDGGENAPVNILNDKFYEVCNQLTLTEHFATPGIVLISKSSMEKLPEDLQTYLTESAKELGAMEIEMDKESQSAAVESLKSEGMVVTEADKEAFKAAAVPIYADATADVSPEIITLLKETLGINF